MEAFDLFKVLFFFYYEGKTLVSSCVGVVLSLAIFSFLAYQFAHSELFRKQSPNVISQIIPTKTARPIEFNSRTPLALGFSYFSFLSERYYDPTVIQITPFLIVLGKEQYVPNHPCNYDDFKEVINETTFEELQINKSICFDNDTTIEKYFI